MAFPPLPPPSALAKELDGVLETFGENNKKDHTSLHEWTLSLVDSRAVVMQENVLFLKRYKLKCLMSIPFFQRVQQRKGKSERAGYSEVK